ncbi:MAG: glutamine--fructose-6-phosphate transaminase (isomerizing) [Clostridia bacterium]|nr:glutamine--fructose-6-phosphate transaminase (isomerizing) [Clostridia bacterium]
MCGIYGIIGKCKNIDKVAINALYELEYRGYDSSGIAFLNTNKEIKVIKSTGKIENLEKNINNHEVSTECLIAHTRWATHGKISTSNAHPHTSENVAIVHNGIITNYEELKNKLNSYKFYGECDSEVIAKLMDYNLQRSKTALEAFCKTIKELKGSYAIECIVKGEYNTIFIARKESPIYVCKYKDTVIASSDLITFPKQTSTYFEVSENQICELKKSKIKFFDLELNEIKGTSKKYDINENKVSLNNYSHFMLKEIFDIPKALNDTMKKLESSDKLNIDLSRFEKVHFIACGTAYHSACVGAFMVQSLCGIDAQSHIASEWIDSPTLCNKNHLFVMISQSGETFDTILALKKAKQNGCICLSITNTSYSTLANLSDYVLPIVAGKEVAVASTKVYNACNLACLYLANKIKAERQNLELNLNDIKIDYNEITKLLNAEFEKEFANTLINYKTIFFLGKCEDYITAMEASLKLKEITYINSSAYPSGELKHGTLALVDNETLIIAYLTNANYTDKMISALSEVKARGGKVLLLSNQTLPKALVDYSIKLSSGNSSINMLLYSIIPMQKLAYYTAIKLNKNPDKPRNLAKSVTVA